MTAPAAPIPAEILAEWRKLADAATAGPWKHTGETGDRKWQHLKSVNDDGWHLLSAEVETDDCDYKQGVANAAFIAASREAVPALLAENERLRGELEDCQLDVSIQEAMRDSENYRADELNNKMVDEHERADSAEAALATMTAAHQERCEKVRELQAECDAWIAKVQRLRSIEQAGRAYMNATLHENAHRHNCMAGCDDDGHECAEYGELWVAETYAMVAFWDTLKAAAGPPA